MPWIRRRPTAPPTPNDEPAVVDTSGAADIQILAHTMIADLFAAGLRIQNIAGRAPEELRAELEEIADQLDKAIHEIRNYAFTHRS